VFTAEAFELFPPAVVMANADRYGFAAMICPCWLNDRSQGCDRMPISPVHETSLGRIDYEANTEP